MSVRHVESSANPFVKELVTLRQRRVRERSGTYLVEGAREVRRALAAGVAARQLVFAPSLMPGGELGEEWPRLAAAAGAETVTLAAGPFTRVSQREHPDGVLLVAVTRRVAPSDVALKPGALALVLSGLEKPGNLGALLRSADAVGVDAVFVCPDPGASGDGAEDSRHGVDLENPNVIRAAMGSSFALPVGVGTAEEVVEALRAANLRVVVTSPAAPLAHWAYDLTGGVALVLGREHEGLSAWWLARADAAVSIPMRASAADSLNVSVAGAVVLYEALRQRVG